MDGTPQLDEIGPSNNPNYGLSTITTQYDPNLPRASNWEFSGGVERQLGAGWALSAMWHRRAYTNFDWFDNLNTSAADWQMAGVWTGPDDPGLPAVARGVQVPIYVTAPGLDIQTGNDFHTVATGDYRTWNGFEVILDGELPRGGFMTASVTAGTNKNHFCNRGNVENPNALRFCETRMPYRPMGKLSGALPLPFDTMISGLVQVFPGAPIQATYAINQDDFPALALGLTDDDPLNVSLIEPGTVFEDYTTEMQLRFDTMISGLIQVFPGAPIRATYAINAADFPALVNLGDPDDANPNLEVNLIEPGTVFEDYTTEMQLRFSKVVTINDVRTRFYMDATNITNRARVTSRNRFYGGGGVKNPDFLRINTIEPGRRLSFGMQMYF